MKIINNKRVTTMINKGFLDQKPGQFAKVFKGLKPTKSNMKIINGIKLIGMLLIVLMASCKKDEGNDPLFKTPTVKSTSPADKATGIVINNTVTVSFSEAMDPATINTSTFTLAQGTVNVPGKVTYADLTATFTPTLNLELNKSYTGTITTSAKSKGGVAIGSNYIFSFTTEKLLDITLPEITSTEPSNNAPNVPRNQIVGINFNEEMDKESITNSTFTLKKGTTTIEGSVKYSGTVATFTPNEVLQSSTTYTATLTKAAKDIAGNTIASNKEWSFTTAGSISGQNAVNLGSAADYVILAKTAINNNPTSAITGDLGLSPAATSYITGLSLTDATGYATSSQVTGKVYAADMADPTPINLTTAVNDMTTAYNDAAGRPSPDFLELNTGDIGGKTLLPGLYKWTNTVTVPSSMTINGGENDIWIFQIAGNLTLSSSVNITLTGGAQAKNIFWQVAGEVTLGTTAHLEGIVLSMTGITLGTGASMNGRALAQTAVILDGNTVVNP